VGSARYHLVCQYSACQVLGLNLLAGGGSVLASPEPHSQADAIDWSYWRASGMPVSYNHTRRIAPLWHFETNLAGRDSNLRVGRCRGAAAVCCEILKSTQPVTPIVATATMAGTATRFVTWAAKNLLLLLTPFITGAIIRGVSRIDHPGDAPVNPGTGLSIQRITQAGLSSVPKLPGDVRHLV